MKWDFPTLVKKWVEGDFRALSRVITKIENRQGDYKLLLEHILHQKKSKVIGLTGPPGAGKSTLVNAVIQILLEQGHRVGLLLIDPSSPFSGGAILGDRIRMTSEMGMHQNLYIRSMASRGSLGGLAPGIFDVLEVMKYSGFDWIFIETVGIGQSEVEIAALAESVVVVLVPESGDEIQTIKSGIMEAADIFVVNKSDRPGAQALMRSLETLVHTKPVEEWRIPVIPMVAIEGKGVKELIEQMDAHHETGANVYRKAALLTRKIKEVVSQQRTLDINEREMYLEIVSLLHGGEHCNVYHWAKKYL